MPCGSRRDACVMAACTSTAAPSRLRFRSNSSVICVAPERVDRGHRLEAGDHRELVLERRGDRRGHRFRARARQTGGDQQRRKVDVRQVADRQRLVGDRAEQRDRRHQQAGGDGPLDKDLGNVHVDNSSGRRRSRASSCVLTGTRAAWACGPPSNGPSARPCRCRRPGQIQSDQAARRAARRRRPAQRPARFAARAVAESDRQRAEQRRHGRHHDRTETNQAALIDRLGRSLACFARPPARSRSA